MWISELFDRHPNIVNIDATKVPTPPASSNYHCWLYEPHLGAHLKSGDLYFQKATKKAGGFQSHKHNP
jgi:hypothetical protein